MSQKWFLKFCAEAFSLNNAPWSGRPTEVDDNQIKRLLENNKYYRTWEIVNILKISKFENHLYQFGYVSLFYMWFPCTI